MTSPSNDETGATGGLSFADPRAAQRLRDIVRQVANERIEINGSNPNVGRVLNVNLANLTATVWLTGDDAPIQVNLFPGSIPLDLGNYRSTAAYDTSAIGTGGLVYCENFRGKPYITRILSGGEYELNGNFAGMSHRMFSAALQGDVSGPAVSPTDIYERHVNVLVNPGAGFVVGNSMLVGPWSGKNDGSMVDGIIELVLSFWVNGSVRNQVRKYQFSVSDRMIVDLEGDEGNKPFWMRLIPETNLGTDPHAELAVDVALVKTGIRTSLEFWFRLVPLDTWADQSLYFMSVKSFGSAFNVGDPRTGRLVMIKETVAAPVQGWVGFHNAGMGWTERDENATFPRGTYYNNDEWSSGSWRSSALRIANDLRWTWRADGQWFWFAEGSLFWEGNILFTGVGPNWNGIHSGFLPVPMPTGAIPVFPSDSTNVASYRRALNGFGRIPLNPGETLYYALCPGSGDTGQGSWTASQNYFFIVDSKTYYANQHNFGLPEWSIPIASRAYTTYGERREIFVHNIQVNTDIADETLQPAIAWYDANHSGIIGSDETETMALSSFRYRAKSAYRVWLKTGASSATVPSVVNWRLKKGTTAAGTDLGEFFRYPMVVANAVHGVSASTIIYNDTTSDVTTAITVTGQSSGSNATTWTRYGSTTSPSVVWCEYIGTSAKWVGKGRQI